MRVIDDFIYINADVQTSFSSKDKLYILQYWKVRLTEQKEYTDNFIYGKYQTIDSADKGSIFACLRTGKNSGRWLVVLHFGGKTVAWSMPEEVKVKGWMAGTYSKGKPDNPTKGVVDLRPWEGLLGVCYT